MRQFLCLNNISFSGVWLMLTLLKLSEAPSKPLSPQKIVFCFESTPLNLINSFFFFFTWDMESDIGRQHVQVFYILF